MIYMIVDEIGVAEYNYFYFGIFGNEIVVKFDFSNVLIGVGFLVYVKVMDVKGLFYVKEFMFSVVYVNKVLIVNFELMEVFNGVKGGIVVVVIKGEDVDSS